MKKFNRGLARPFEFVDTRAGRGLLSTTKKSAIRLKRWGEGVAFAKSLVVRGVGYTMFEVRNDITSSNKLKKPLQGLEETRASEENSAYWKHSAMEVPFKRYLVIRAGHTEELCQPIPEGVFLRSGKKNKKLVVYGKNKTTLNLFVRSLFDYRQPSVYTGRGVRLKHVKPLRKAGKADKQKGRAF